MIQTPQNETWLSSISKKGNRSLWLSVQVENLSFVVLFDRPVSTAAPITTVVDYNNVLKHVVIQCQCHLVKGANILI